MPFQVSLQCAQRDPKFAISSGNRGITRPKNLSENA
jgi:hypothetical protein